jgi:hypothetical protein
MWPHIELLVDADHGRPPYMTYICYMVEAVDVRRDYGG